MAINKNFVVKNGLEVNTNLLVADSDNTRVGVATTSPDYLLHVFGGIGATNLTVTGLSTLSGLSTFQSGFFVNGISTHIGVGTFQDNVFIEGQLFNSDTTENTLGDVDSGSVQLDGGLGVAKNTTIGAGLSVLDGLTVVGLSTFVGIVTTSSDLFVGGDLFISEDLVLDTNLNILGIATIGRLHVTGIGTIDGDARVGGALTVTSSVDFNDDLDVDGRTELDITNISETLNVTGISTFASAVDINDDLDVDGHTELDNLNVSGLSTFVGFSTFNDSVFIQSNLSVGGITTSNSYTIDGTTVITSGRELQNIASLDATTTATIESAIASGPNTFDDLKVTGISTFIGIATFGSGVGIADSIFHLEDNTTSFRFPSDGTFTVEATGTERLRVNENGVNITGLVTASSGGKFNQVDVGKSNINGITGDVNLTLDAGGGNGGAVIIASDVGLQVSDNLNVTGITTLGYTTATSIVSNEGLTVTGVTTLATFTATSGVVGSAVTVDSSGIDVTGVVTATSFVGDGSQLTNTGAALTTSSAVLRILSTSLTSGIVTSAVAEAELTYDAATNVLNVNGGLNVTSGVSTLTSAVVGSAVSIADYGIHATGVVTATGGFNIGIQSASGEVTTGVITALNFIGAGNTFAYNASTKTVDISIAGNVGGGGTWQTYTAGIATSKSVGVNTSNLDNSSLTGVGDSFQGLYIGNGMLIVDNALNGDHYIGTNFNGLMAGPVTVNGTLTVDGNWVVV
jgi:hypothetical protein